MSFYNKKYYKQRNKELEVANEKLKAEKSALQDAIRFVMSQKNVHSINYEATWTHWGASTTHTKFEYVDETGKYHYITRDFKCADLVLISASAEAAIFGYQQEDKTTYWLLNKADELFAEIPEVILCTKNKICERCEDER
jgi:hypothetical protein